MASYVRAFCTAETVPSVHTVLASLSHEGVTVAASIDDPALLKTPDWEHCLLIYREESMPIAVACYRNNGDECLAEEEIERFRKEVGFPFLSRTRRRVVAHLKATRFIICSLLLSDIDEAGQQVNSEFFSYFIEHCGGMLHTDAGGFVA